MICCRMTVFQKSSNIRLLSTDDLSIVIDYSITWYKGTAIASHVITTDSPNTTFSGVDAILTLWADV